MVESSRFWDGLTTGEATSSPYSALKFAEFLYAVFGNPTGLMGFSGIFITGTGGPTTPLNVTGTATPVSVATGQAMVLGRFYSNDAPVTFAVASPAANPRIDRIVLRMDTAAQTVRLAKLLGAEAATPSPPALTQSAATWEVTLAQVYITTGGVITVRDERVGLTTLAPGILFRDLRDRVFEEFFDHFNSDSVTTPTNWRGVVSGTGAISQLTAFPSAVRLSTGGATAATAILDRNTRYPHRLSQAPLLFEARMAFTGSANANGRMLMSLVSAAAAEITFGFNGSFSATNLALSATTGGSTNYITGQAVDVTGAYHTYGLYFPSSAGPAIVLYDGVAIGQLSTSLHASGTNVKPSFECSNNAAALSEIMDIDWVRLVRGA